VSGRNSFALADDPPAMIGTRVLDASRDLVFVWTDLKHARGRRARDAISVNPQATIKERRS
jgi:hypothetical protein